MIWWGLVLCNQDIPWVISIANLARCMSLNAEKEERGENDEPQFNIFGVNNTLQIIFKQLSDDIEMAFFDT